MARGAPGAAARALEPTLPPGQGGGLGVEGGSGLRGEAKGEADTSDLSLHVRVVMSTVDGTREGSERRERRPAGRSAPHAWGQPVHTQLTVHGTRPRAPLVTATVT